MPEKESVIKLFISVACALALFGLSTRADADWSVVGDWAITSNPNGQWTYGYSPTGASSDFAAFNASTNTGISTSWYPNNVGPNTGPVIWQNTASYTQYGVTSGQVSLQAGPNGEYAVVRWTSPIAGTITINGAFGAGDSGSAAYFIYLSNVQSGTWTTVNIFSQSPTSNSASFNLTETVSQGTMIDFMVGQCYIDGNTPLDATISLVPLPSAMLLLAPGLIGLAAIRKRFKTPTERQ